MKTEELFEQYVELSHRVRLLGGIVQNPLTSDIYDQAVLRENLMEWQKISSDIVNDLESLRSETIAHVNSAAESLK